eukprot:Em0007g668a
MGSVFKSQDTSGTSVYRVKMEINGEMLMMEIDTGAAVSLISEDTYRKKFSKLQLTASAVRLATYTTQRIEGMSRTVCSIDDILITGDSEDDHLKNLELVLGRLKTHGITVRKSKCVFMANSVEFWGIV